MARLGHRNMDSKNMNMNMNMNMDVGSGSSVGIFQLARFNSNIFRNLMNYSTNDFYATTNIPKHPSDWDADLKSYTYLQAFLGKVPDWFDRYRQAALEGDSPADSMTTDELARQVKYILDLTAEREGRFAEAIDQNDADGAVGYWLGMLGVNPARHPGTYLMIRVARRIGEHVVMCLKDHFAGARPSQLCPGIVPMFDPPGTPSFPSGHALQAYLISHLLAGSLPGLPQTRVPATGDDPGHGVIYDLAARVADNRIVAGVHFHCDNEAGRRAAFACFTDLQTVPAIWTDPDGLKARVQEEFPQYC